MKYLFILIGLLFLTGCGGGHNAIPSGPVSISIAIADNSHAIPTNLPQASPPPPLDPVNNPYVNATPFPTATPQGKDFGVLDGWPKSKPITGNDKSYNATQDGSGQLGNSVVNTNYNGYYVANTGYATAEINSSGTTAYTNFLFAPTTKQGNGCIEISMTYTRYVNVAGVQYQNTLRLLRAYDFCLNGGEWTNYYKVVDANFQSTYERDLGYGVPQYVIEEFQSSTWAWVTVIYNFNTGNWELLYVSQPGNNDYNGAMTWDMYEMHYTVGPCTIMPPVISSNFQHYDTSVNQWTGTSNTNIFLENNIPFPSWGACTLADSTGPATNTITFQNIANNDYSAWVVNSAGYVNANQ